MCLYPKIIKNPKYKKNKKNGGIIPAISDERVLYVPIGCGNCIECCKQKARSWQVRLLEDLKENKNGIFVTLTFNNESIKNLWTEIRKETSLEGYNIDNAIATLAVRRFLERWRKEHKKSLRHWLVTELGHNGTENIHLHGIVYTNEDAEKITKHWQYGYVWKGSEENGKIKNYVNERTVNYIIKYVTKKDEKHKEYKPIILTSAGIGSNYTKGMIDWKNNKYNGKETKEYYKTKAGYKIALPNYWKNKIYTEEEKEKLWIQKIEKQERWVCGERIDISNGDEEYYKLLAYHRRINKKLGYGDDEKNWDRIKYEKERRNAKILERIENAFGESYRTGV